MAIRDLCRQTQEAAALELDALEQMLAASGGMLATLDHHARSIEQMCDAPMVPGAP